VPLHSDAVQASGTLSLKVDELGVDLNVVGRHKSTGPRALVAYRAVKVCRSSPGHRRQPGGKRRAGTEELPTSSACSGVGTVAAERAAAGRLSALRDI